MANDVNMKRYARAFEDDAMPAGEELALLFELKLRQFLHIHAFGWPVLE